MDNFLNFVYDDWDEVNDLPLPNRLSDYVHQDDNENTWVISTQPMAVFALTKIKNWKISDVEPQWMSVYRLTKCGQLRRRITCVLDNFGSASLGRFLVA
jgi:Zn/Cd-binding protein ZinT